jgi:hypothetical protein
MFIFRTIDSATGSNQIQYDPIGTQPNPIGFTIGFWSVPRDPKQGMLLALACIEREKDDPLWDSNHRPSGIRADVLSQLD